MVEIADRSVQLAAGAAFWTLPGAAALGRTAEPLASSAQPQGHHYVYDAWNRLKEVWKDDGDGDLETTGTPPPDEKLAWFSYDGLNGGSSPSGITTVS
ncbi:MAG: hypothetical protein ABFD92_05115 [Planctomycetaceae bacterium]|nr:hypothetical protein [Planctomycetaceae bacterium]